MEETKEGSEISATWNIEAALEAISDAVKKLCALEGPFVITPPEDELKCKDDESTLSQTLCTLEKIINTLQPAFEFIEFFEPRYYGLRFDILSNHYEPNEDAIATIFNTPNVALDVSFEQLLNMLSKQYTWIPQANMQIGVKKNDEYTFASLSQTKTVKLYAPFDQVFFAPVLSIKVQTLTEIMEISVFGHYTFNELADALSKENPTEFTGYVGDQTVNERSFPILLKAIQLSANNTYQTKGNPLDQPMYGNKGLWAYLSKNVSFASYPVFSKIEQVFHSAIINAHFSYGNVKHIEPVIISYDLDFLNADARIVDRIREHGYLNGKPFESTPYIDNLFCHQIVFIVFDVNVFIQNVSNSSKWSTLVVKSDFTLESVRQKVQNYANVSRIVSEPDEFKEFSGLFLDEAAPRYLYDLDVNLKNLTLRFTVEMNAD